MQNKRKYRENTDFLKSCKWKWQRFCVFFSVQLSAQSVLADELSVCRAIFFLFIPFNPGPLWKGQKTFRYINHHKLELFSFIKFGNSFSISLYKTFDTHTKKKVDKLPTGHGKLDTFMRTKKKITKQKRNNLSLAVPAKTHLFSIFFTRKKTILLYCCRNHFVITFQDIIHAKKWFIIRYTYMWSTHT